MIPMDMNRVRANVREAETEDLLDRVTAFRAGMEEDALALIEGELSRRGVDAEQIRLHEQERRADAIFLADGTALACSFCYRPARLQAWAWHKIWGRFPVFPRLFAYCAAHERSQGKAITSEADSLPPA